MKLNANVRKRGKDKWVIVVDLGEQSARKCAAGCRRGGGVVTLWPEDTDEVCPRCRGPLASPVRVRRQRWAGTFEKKKFADARLDAMRGEVFDGGTAFPREQSLRDYLDTWIVAHASQVRPGTHRRYSSLLKHHILPRLGAVNLRDLTAKDCNRAWAEMTEAGCSAASVRQARALLARAVKDAVASHELRYNPVAASRAPKVERPDLADLSAEDVRALLVEAAGTDRWEVPLAIAAYTGLRRSEVLGLRWSDVDLDAGFLRVERGLHLATTFRAPDDRYVFEPPKTKLSRRRVALSPSLVTLLRAHKVRQAERRLVCGEGWQAQWGGLVVDRGDGAPVYPDDLSKAFLRLAARAGLPDGARLHDLRHATVANLIDQGVEVDVISKRLGHSSVAFTLSVYGHLREAREDAAADAMERALRG